MVQEEKQENRTKRVKAMRSSYRAEDVTLLLKDVTGLVKPSPTEEREKLIQAGRHYCEMLPIEYVPTEKYMEVYQEELARFAEPTAAAVGNLSDKIMERRGKGIDGNAMRYLLERYEPGQLLFVDGLERGRFSGNCRKRWRHMRACLRSWQRRRTRQVLRNYAEAMRIS